MLVMGLYPIYKEVFIMPGRHGTGHMGTHGCSRNCGCRGAGLRLRDGTGCGWAGSDDRKEILKFQRNIFESKIKNIDKLIRED